MHTFRRLNVSWRQEVGATPFEAMKAAGHAKPSTTWDYTVTDIERDPSVARMRERLTIQPRPLQSATDEATARLIAEHSKGPVQ